MSDQDWKWYAITVIVTVGCISFGLMSKQRLDHEAYLKCIEKHSPKDCKGE